MKVYCRSCEDEHQVPFRPTADELNCPACCGRMVSSLNWERTPIERKSKPKPPRAISPASEAQRAKAKVAGYCLGCGIEGSQCVLIDPAHLVDRSLGGCDEPLCTVPLCRRCHRAYDDHQLDLLPKLEPDYREELAHAVGHLGLVLALERVTGDHWRPVAQTAETVAAEMLGGRA